MNKGGPEVSMDTLIFNFLMFLGYIIFCGHNNWGKLGLIGAKLRM